MPIEISFEELKIWGISVVSEEGNWVCHYHRVFNWVRKPVLVADVWPQHKSRRNPCFWGTVSAVGLSLISVQTSFCGKSPHRLLCAAHLGGFTYWSGFFMCNGAFWGVFAEKFALSSCKCCGIRGERRRTPYNYCDEFDYFLKVLHENSESSPARRRRLSQWPI